MGRAFEALFGSSGHTLAVPVQRCCLHHVHIVTQGCCQYGGTPRLQEVCGGHALGMQLLSVCGDHVIQTQQL
jgi:hypothetical protein